MSIVLVCPGMFGCSWGVTNLYNVILPTCTVEENEFYGYKIIICMLWLVKQSTLTWLLLGFMFQGMLFKLP